MSFFGLGGKDVYFMGYAASSLFDQSKNIIQEVALGSIINGGNYVEALSRDAYPNSMYAHLQHMYNYCEANYAFGLPNLTVQDKFLIPENIVRSLVSQYMYPTLKATDTIDVLYNAIAAGKDIEYYVLKHALDNNILNGYKGLISGAFNTPDAGSPIEDTELKKYSYDINFTQLRYERANGITVTIVTAADGSHTYTANLPSSSHYGPPTVTVTITPTSIPANDFVPSGKEFSVGGDTYFFWDSAIPTTEGTVDIYAFATHTSALWEHYSGKFHINNVVVDVTDIVPTFKSRTDTVSSYNMKLVTELDATIRIIEKTIEYSNTGPTVTAVTEVSSTTGKAPLVFAEWNQDITEFVTAYSSSLIVRILDSNGNPKTGWLSAIFNDSNAPASIKQFISSLSFQPYYPIFPLKRNWEYIDVDDPNPAWLVDTPNPVDPTVYTGSVYKALNKLKINAKNIIEAIKEDDNANEIIDAYIYFATDVLQDDPRLNVYFYKYFKWLIEIIPGAGMLGEHTFIVSDDTFKTSYKFKQISQMVSQGVVARKGKAIKIVSDTGDITVKYQLTDATYEEVTIYGLRMFNSIYAGHDGVEVSVHNWAVDDERNHSPFLIPLSQPVLKQVNARTKEIVLKYSAKLVCYTQHKEHVKWYRTGWFGNLIKIVLFIIAMVMNYYAPGSGQSFLTWVGNLTASQLISMVIITTLKSILIGAIMNAIMVHVLVPLFGAKLALVFTIAAMVYGMFGATGYDLPFATDVGTLAGPALNAATAAYSAEQMSEIQDAYEQFNAMVKDRQQELKDAAKELGYYQDSETNARIDPLGFGLNVDMGGYESPDMYLLRKSTNASLALTGYEYVQAFYADKLSLG